ncbi:ion transport peptide-like [Uloborus diversus]|uniref:ion transport peptide-like n=1 Tax=Uloborus diversus TaxID=327109 RepID=UPI002409FA47|nr:ion transport peptide-like [Uloborus diversus]
MMKMIVILMILSIFATCTAMPDSEPIKRSFSGLGCMGVYDKAKFARLERVCEECYQMFRESDVYTACRANCFKNDFFNQCISALLLQKDQQRLGSMVEELYGR